MGRSVVVTGANSGIGLATAIELARAGYQVLGTVRGEAKADVLLREAAERGATMTPVLCDVGDAEACEKGFVEIARQTGAVEDVTDEQARAQLEVNLVAPARVARLVLPAMRERRDGRIVNVSSIAGRVSLPLMGWYAASKHGLEALSDALRVEVAPFGVKVVLVEPGSFGTDIWAQGQSSLPDPTDSAYAAAYARVQAITNRGGALPDPAWVARTIRLALANPLPLARYLVGVDAVGGVVGQALSPTLVQDYVKGVGAGLRRLPFLRLPFLPR
ncbi:MAG TPA: SDR family NAD(P)-dependent oxidoreductase [Frankiaceae bacterium]|nr:SDR family NAD(P)-dependent oxidoreductase [Frankiaceae bacterium]